jgi:signal transduction histidine kinase
MVDAAHADRLIELGQHTAALLHELRQPLFAAKALAQLAEHQPERAAALLPQILQQIGTLERLVDAHAGLGRPVLFVSERFDARAAIDTAMVVLARRAADARVAIDVEAPEPMLVCGSSLGVQQAVVNLVQNAIEAVATVPGGRVRVRALPGEPARIRVEDNGPGVAAEVRAALFQPFRTTKPSGTGLGLTISRDAVAAFGGDVRLLDGPGSVGGPPSGPGAVFEITLPSAG